MTSLMQWFRLKKYQYEVTFSLYMLTPTERIIFSTFTLLCLSSSPLLIRCDQISSFSSLSLCW